MNTKPNVPGDIFMGEKEYSWRKDWNVNGWLFVATIISAVCDIIFPQVTRHWSLEARVGIVFTEFTAIGLWGRSLTLWIRGMDELHRRITTGAILFAVSATFLFVMLWHALERAGLWIAIFPKLKDADICTIGHEFLLLTLFYFIGQTIFNRNYK